MCSLLQTEKWLCQSQLYFNHFCFYRYTFMIRVTPTIKSCGLQKLINGLAPIIIMISKERPRRYRRRRNVPPPMVFCERCVIFCLVWIVPWIPHNCLFEDDTACQESYIFLESAALLWVKPSQWTRLPRIKMRKSMKKRSNHNKLGHDDSSYVNGGLDSWPCCGFWEDVTFMTVGCVVLIAV